MEYRRSEFADSRLPVMLARGWRKRPEIHALWLALLLAAYCTAVLNGAFWSSLSAVLGQKGLPEWLMLAAWFVGLTAYHFMWLGVAMLGRPARWVGLIVLLTTAVAGVFASRYSVHYDVSMLKNVFNTHTAEAAELFSWTLLRDVLLLALPGVALLFAFRTKRETWLRMILLRLGVVAGCVAVVAAMMLLGYKNLSSQMRNNTQMRHLIVPGSFITSSLIIATERRIPDKLAPLGEDAKLAQAGQPALLVLVVGETARAANWGLSGYERDTTPRLRSESVFNFPYAASCGTNTEVSVPCLFSRQGRRNYNEADIRSSESLLHVAARAGVAVSWIDNQSGCKGVCKGLKEIEPAKAGPSPHCSSGACFDEALIEQLQKEISTKPANQMIVLHQLGSHGPAYFLRYPAAFARFKPECRNADLGTCTDEQIRNAYDNTLVYTDHVLASIIGVLKGVKDRRVSLIYVSDHGESLGEKSLYLHGVPYAVAPDVQTRVPFVMWFSAEQFSAKPGLSQSCVHKVAGKPAHHDNVFDTALGLLGVQSAVYQPGMDLLHDCRS